MARFSEELVIGAGVSGLMFLALVSHEERVTLIERPSKDDALGRRILVSGNGRCNFFNENLLLPETFDHPPFDVARDIVFKGEEFLPQTILNYMTEKGLSYQVEDGRYYPYFNRAECFHRFLLSLIDFSNVDIIRGTAMRIDRDQHEVFVDIDGRSEVIRYADLLLATGGFSYDRRVDYTLLDSLGIPHRPFSSCLCPIKTIEKIPSFLFGQRLRGRVSLFSGDRLVCSEEGEVLFRRDGLSGIVIFNLSLVIDELLREGAENIRLTIDYTSHGTSHLNPRDVGCDYPEFLLRYLKIVKKEPGDPLVFTFRDLYPINQSQISYGGILLDEIDTTSMRIKRDPSISAVGEVIDQAFPCGGYNIGMALIEGYKAARYGKRHTS